MSKEIDVILIDPFLRTIIKSTIENDLKSLQHAVGDNHIEFVFVDDENIMYVDEEGLFKDNQKFFVLDVHGRKMPLAGKAIILGNDMENGETIGTKMNALDAYKIIEFKELSEIVANKQIG